MASIKKMQLYLLVILPLCSRSDWLDHDICTPEKDVLRCVCHKNESTTLIETHKYSFTDIVVQGCGSLRLGMDTFLNRRINSIELIDIHSIAIRSFALQSVTIESHVLISNVSNLDIMANVFNDRSSFGALLLRRVRAKRLPKSAFHLKSVARLEVSGCEFGTIEKEAFKLENVSSVTVDRCDIEYLSGSSFLIETAENVSFSNTFIGKTETGSVATNTTGWFRFAGCSFGELAPFAFQSAKLSNFIFENCTVERSRSHAFENIFASETLAFENNRFDAAENYSLLSDVVMPMSSDRTVIVSGNRFKCDCNVSWLWDHGATNRYFMETSLCLEADISLMSLSPAFDAEGACLNLSAVQNHSLPLSSGVSNTGDFLSLLSVATIATVSISHL